MGGFRRIYPPPKNVEDKYAKYFNNLSSLFQTTAAQKAREQASRLLHVMLFLFSYQKFKKFILLIIAISKSRFKLTFYNSRGKSL